MKEGETRRDAGGEGGQPVVKINEGGTGYDLAQSVKTIGTWARRTRA